MIYIFMAEGFEETELTAPADLLRRAGHEVCLVSVTGDKTVAGAHGIKICADILFEDKDLKDGEMYVLPGGLPGTTNLGAHEGLKTLLTEADKDGKHIAAICAAPTVLGKFGLLNGKYATCYPGCEEGLTGALAADDDAAAITDGNITTSVGPGTAIDFGLELIEVLDGVEKADEIADEFCY